MGSRPLPATKSVLSVVFRPCFAIPYSVYSTLSILVMYFMEKQSYENSADVLFVSPELWINIFSYTGCISILLFYASSGILRNVATGVCPPIQIETLKSLPYPFSALCGYTGERQLVYFILQILVFPGLVILFVLHGISFCVGTSWSEWKLPLDLYLASSALWRYIIFSIAYTINFFASLNPSQKALKEYLEEQK